MARGHQREHDQGHRAADRGDGGEREADRQRDISLASGAPPPARFLLEGRARGVPGPFGAAAHAEGSRAYPRAVEGGLTAEGREEAGPRHSARGGMGSPARRCLTRNSTHRPRRMPSAPVGERPGGTRPSSCCTAATAVSVTGTATATTRILRAADRGPAACWGRPPWPRFCAVSVACDLERSRVKPAQHLVESPLALEADAGDLRESDSTVADHGVVGEAAGGLELAGVGLVAAELEGRGDV
jgi:hypothetical protein